MAKVPKIRVQGLDKALLRLDVIGDIERRGEVQNILVDAAKIIKAQAEANIDRMPRRDIGWKQHLIRLRTKRGERVFGPVRAGDIKRAVQAFGTKDGLGAVAKIAFTLAPHAWFLEFGTSRNGKQLIPPWSFWRTAVQSKRREISKYIKTEVSSLLRTYVDADEPEKIFTRRRKKAA